MLVKRFLPFKLGTTKALSPLNHSLSIPKQKSRTINLQINNNLKPVSEINRFEASLMNKLFSAIISKPYKL